LQAKGKGVLPFDCGGEAAGSGMNEVKGWRCTVECKKWRDERERESVEKEKGCLLQARKATPDLLPSYEWQITVTVRP
jgi:hypothetical protein